jgi:hypothetical protein
MEGICFGSKRLKNKKKFKIVTIGYFDTIAEWLLDYL